jgi:hypothetical protein
VVPLPLDGNTQRTRQCFQQSSPARNTSPKSDISMVLESLPCCYPILWHPKVGVSRVTRQRKQETCASDRTRKRRSDSIQIALPLNLIQEKVSPVQSSPSINSSPSQNAKSSFRSLKRQRRPLIQACKPVVVPSNPIQSIPFLSSSKRANPQKSASNGTPP